MKDQNSETHSYIATFFFFYSCCFNIHCAVVGQTAKAKNQALSPYKSDYDFSISMWIVLDAKLSLICQIKIH